MVVMFIGVPIAFAMGIVGFFGLVGMIGWDPSLAMVAGVTMETGLDYGLSVVPLFILMGNFVTHAGLSDELYAASNAWLGTAAVDLQWPQHWPAEVSALFAEVPSPLQLR